MTIHKLFRKYEALDTDKISEESINATSEDLTRENAAQMYAGLNKQGAAIGTYKNSYYADKKHQMNPAPGYGVPDLKKSGALYRGLYAEAQSGKIDIDSTVPYAKFNEKRYGKEIYGLGGVFKANYIDNHLQPVFIAEIKKALK